MNFKQVITDANTEYIYSVDMTALEAAFASIEELLSERTLSESNRANGEALRMRLGCKIFALKYFDELAEKWIERLSAFVDDNLPLARAKSYGKSEAVMTGTLELLRGISRTVAEMDELGALANSRALLADGGQSILEKARQLSASAAALDMPSPFGESVAFIDIKSRLGEELSAKRRGIEDAYVRALDTAVPSKKLDLKRCDYYPLPERDEGGKANAVILNTPFTDEARLYASHAVASGEAIFEYDVNAIGASSDGIARAFALIRNRRSAALVTHAEMLPTAAQRMLLGECMHIGKDGVTVFVVDVEGGTLYDVALAVAAEDENLSALDISASYITMPEFEDVCEELKALKLATDGECEEKLREMPFLGFTGLNEITAPENRKVWSTRGKKISDGNAVAAKRYIAGLRAAMLFIDDGWGSFKSGAVVAGGVDEFDYDDIRGVDLGNIRKIIESDATVFGKCGMLARYCTTGTADASVWYGFSREQMLERLTLAVKTVYRVLGIAIVPEVRLVDSMSNNGAGGLCVDGGKRIDFKYDACRGDITWTRGTIVHECFHALQAKLRDGNWSKWYYDNLGITRGRACRWQITNKLYDEDVESKVYKVHMIEADAKAFEVDCQDGLDEYWSTVDFD